MKRDEYTLYQVSQYLHFDRADRRVLNFLKHEEFDVDDILRQIDFHADNNTALQDSADMDPALVEEVLKNKKLKDLTKLRLDQNRKMADLQTEYIQAIQDKIPSYL